VLAASVSRTLVRALAVFDGREVAPARGLRLRRNLAPDVVPAWSGRPSRRLG